MPKAFPISARASAFFRTGPLIPALPAIPSFLVSRRTLAKLKRGIRKHALWQAALTAMLALLAASCTDSKPADSKSEPPPPNNQIVMELEAQNHIGLMMAPVKMGELEEFLQVTGTVQPADTRVTGVRALARGRLSEVMVHVGDRVTQGQLLARYDNIEAGELVTQYASAQADLAKLHVQLDVVQRQTARNRDLLDAGAIPRKVLEASTGEEQSLQESIRAQEGVIAGIAGRLQRFGVRPDDVSSARQVALTAPFSGVVIKMEAAPGKVIGTEDVLFTIADLSTVWVQAEVYEKDLGRIREGQAAQITVDTYPGEVFQGRITYIGDFLDPQTRTARVRCEVSNPQTRLKLDMFASVQLPTTFRRKTVVVPPAALQQVDGRSVVFVVTGPTTFRAQTVQTGNTVGDQTEILSGVEPGSEIVVQGSFHLKSIVAGKDLGEE